MRPGFGKWRSRPTLSLEPATLQHHPTKNAAFAAKYVPHAQLDVLPGPVGHEIFDNECDQLGRDNYPESCADAPGVDRSKLHEYIGNAALRFFDANLNVRRESAR